MDAEDLELLMSFQQNDEKARRRQERAVFLCCQYPDDAYYGNAVEKSLSDKDLVIDKPDLHQALEWSGGELEMRQAMRQQILGETGVLVVLLGVNTWRTYQTDWLLAAALDDDEGFIGVLGLLLPTHPDFYKLTYSAGLLPPRMADNVANGFVELCKWTDDAEAYMGFIEKAVEKKKQVRPNNLRPLLKANLEGAFWI